MSLSRGVLRGHFRNALVTVRGWVTAEACHAQNLARLEPGSHGATSKTAPSEWALFQHGRVLVGGGISGHTHLDALHEDVVEMAVCPAEASGS